jgi:hypothetical protein
MFMATVYDTGSTLSTEPKVGGVEPVQLESEMIDEVEPAQSGFEVPEDTKPVPSEPEVLDDTKSILSESETPEEESLIMTEPDVMESENTENEITDDSSSLLAVMKSVDAIEHKVARIEDASEKAATEMRDLHRLYHNEFAGRLKSMQDELEQYREIEKGRIYDGILGEVAKLYCDYESVLNDISDEKAAKKIRYLFEDILQLLEANDVHIQKSTINEKRNARYCQVVDRIETNSPEQHDTVVKSISVGFHKDNRALIKERINIYLYAKKAEQQSGEN